MRVSQVMLAAEFGGAERYFVELSRSLAEQGHQVQAICHRRFPAREQLTGLANLRLDTVPVAGPWHPWGHGPVLRRLRAFAPDIIHAHMARAADFAGRAGARLGVPVVVKLHNYVKLKSYRRVDHFVATTGDQVRYLRDRGIAAERVSLIPNFSALPAAAAPRPPPHGEPVFLSYGRMVNKKGFDVLLQAFADYVRQSGGGRLVLGGAGPEAAALRAQAEGLGIEARTEFPGWLSDVPTALARADVFVLPSRDEPFGIALLEAMAMGLPIVATRTRGPQEILDPASAWLVAPGSALELTSAMEQLTQDPAEAQRRAARALERFRQAYAAEAVVPRLLDLYQGLLSGRTSPVA